MARVAFFTEKLPPDTDPITGFSFELMRSLGEQQHEVRIFSTYREGAPLPPAHPRLEILRPFRRWSWLELPRLIPILLEFQPQILHVIQPRAEALRGFTNALNALPGLAPLIGRPMIVSSFYDLRKETLGEHHLLLSSSTAITVTNRSQQELINDYVAQLPAKSKRPETVITPIAGLGAQTSSEADSDSQEIVAADPVENLREFVEIHDPLIFIPGDLDLHRSIDGLFEILATLLETHPGSGLLFGGGWGDLRSLRRKELMAIFDERDLGSRVLITGPLSDEAERIILRAARVIFTASLPPESLQLTRILRGALGAGKVPIMSEGQARLDSLPWQDRVHAFIAADHPVAWATALADALASPRLLDSMGSALPEFARLQALDQPGNTMSRLYARLLDRERR